MRLIILLRNDTNVNQFRDILIDSIASGEGDECYLGSGFFQELKKTRSGIDKYRASNQTSSSHNRLCCILEGKNVKITTIGIHNSTWKKPYAEFCKSLHNHRVSLTPYYLSNSWHAKTFVLLKNERPILGIIGSSNMTRPAFSSGGNFNFEADVVMWDETISGLDKIINISIEGNENPFGTIVADYDPIKNKGVTIEDRLKFIVNEIKEIIGNTDKFDFETELNN